MPTRATPPRDCETVVRALWDYLDRQLERPDLQAIDAHLAECASCRAHATFERRLVDEIRALRSRLAQPAVLRARILDVLRRERDAESTD